VTRLRTVYSAKRLQNPAKSQIIVNILQITLPQYGQISVHYFFIKRFSEQWTQY